MRLHAQIIYCIYILYLLCQHFFKFFSGPFTAESIWQLQLLLNITRKIESMWDLKMQSYEKNAFLVNILISFHPFYPFNFGRFRQWLSKKIMEFKKQETHKRIKQTFKLLWSQQNFHRNVQHRLIAALLSMRWLIEFFFFSSFLSQSLCLCGIISWLSFKAQQ